MSAEATPPAPGAFGTWTVRFLALIGVLGCLALIVIAIGIGVLSGPRNDPAKVETSDSKETFTIDNVAAVPGTRLIRMEVEASGGTRGSLSGPRGGDRRNIVLLDSVTGASRRILPDNKRHIDEFRFLPGGADDHLLAETGLDERDSGKAPTALWYLLMIDQPGDAGLKDLVVGSIATGKQVVVLTGIDGIDSAWLADAGHIALILRDHRKLSYRLIDTASFKVSASHPIAID